MSLFVKVIVNFLPNLIGLYKSKNTDRNKDWIEAMITTSDLVLRETPRIHISYFMINFVEKLWLNCSIYHKMLNSMCFNCLFYLLLPYKKIFSDNFFEIWWEKPEGAKEEGQRFEVTMNLWGFWYHIREGTLTEKREKE